MDPVHSLRDWQDLTIDDSSPDDAVSDLNSMVQMTSNLSEQVEYSNSLLKQINKLETTNAELSDQAIAGENEIYELKDLLNESQACIVNLQAKLKVTEADKQKLDSSYSQWGSQKEALISEVETLKSEKEIMVKHAEEQAAENLAHMKKISVLEVKIQSMEHHEQESNRLGSTLNSRLKFENEKLAADLEASKNANTSFHDNYNSLRDENVALKKSMERLLRLNNDEMLEKEELSRRNKTLTAQNVSLSDELQVALEQNVELEQEHGRIAAALAESCGRVAQLNEQAEAQMRDRRAMEVRRGAAVTDSSRGF
jgi:chromosome segregation ATPase